MELSVIKTIYFLLILQILNKINGEKVICEFNKRHDVCILRDIHINSTTIVYYEMNSIRHPIKIIFTWPEIYKFPSRLLNFYPTTTSLTLNFGLLTDIGESSFNAGEKLIKLDLAFNDLTNLSASCFQGATNLLDLNLSHNRLSYLDSHGLIHLESLKNLDLSYNQFVNFNVEALKSFNFAETLEHFYLNNNQINSINFTKISLNHIKTINLSKNRLISIVFDFKSLRQINIEKNILSSIEIKNADNLISLNCNENMLTNLKFLTDLKELTQLDLSNNLITNFIPVNKLKKLKQIILKNSGFTIYDFQLFSKLENLMSIDLSDNNLNSLNLKYITSEDVVKFKIENNNFTEIIYKEINEKFINLRSIAFYRNNLQFNFNCTYLQEIVDNFAINSVRVIPDSDLLRFRDYNLPSIQGILCFNGSKGPEIKSKKPMYIEVKNREEGGLTREEIIKHESENQEDFSEECIPIEKTAYFMNSLFWTLILIVVCFLFYKMLTFFKENDFHQFLVRFRTSQRSDANLLCNEF